MVLSTLWAKVTQLDLTFNMRQVNDAPTISVEDFLKIILRAAPFVTILDVSSSRHKFRPKYVMIGSYCYKVKDYSSETILPFLVHNLTEITEVGFDSEESCSPEIIKGLFTANKITNYYFVASINPSNYYKDVPTDRVKELFVHFSDVDEEFASFEGVGTIQNLKKISVFLIQSNKIGFFLYSPSLI